MTEKQAITRFPILKVVAGLMLCAAPLEHVDARIVLTSIVGSEGIPADTTAIKIDGSGSPSADGDFAVMGSVSASGALNRSFAFTINAVGLASGSGARVTDAWIDRDDTGRLGVRGGGGNGIDRPEGFLIGIGAARLEPGHAWQLTGIRFEFVDGDESFTIVNRNDPSRRITGKTNDMVDVSSLGMFVNGGSADAEVAAVFANPTAAASSGFRITAFELDAVRLTPGPDSKWRSVLYPENWQPPATASFDHDKFIQDFSYAGYRRGEVPVPRVTGPVFDATAYGADPTGEADSTAAIRAALVAAKRAGGGVVSLPQGTFKIGHTAGGEVLRISGNGVVLRGSGPDKTFLLNTTVAMRDRSIIRIHGLNPAEGPPVPIVTDITTPTKRLYLADASSFSPGNLVEVLRDFTQAWIHEHGQEAYWNRRFGIPEPANYRRLVTAVNTTENWIEVDVPMRYTCLTRDHARVRKLAGRISECGVEDLSIGNVQHPGSAWGEEDHEVAGTAAYDVASSWAINVRQAVNCWISNVRSFQPAGNTSSSHVQSNGILLGKSKNITVRNCHFQRPQYGGGGGNGYMYRLQDANDCLVVDSTAEFSRHGFVVSHSGTTGNVFLRCEDRTTNRATGSGGDGYLTSGGDGSDNHMHFSHSNLWDNCRAVDSFFEAIFRATPGHGLSCAHSLYWNTSGSGSAYPGKLIATEQGRYGYVIGTSGTVDVVTTRNPALHHTAPADHVEGVGLGATLYPPSIYQDQLKRRLGPGIKVTGSAVGLCFEAARNVSLDGGTYGQKILAESIHRHAAGLIGVSLDAMAKVDATHHIGAKLASGTIERDGSGRIGVAPGGIHAFEGIGIAIDATAIDPRVRIRIESLTVQFVNADESFTIVNRGDVARRFTAGGNTSGASLVIGSDVSMIDVRGLDLTVTGGQAGGIATLFGNAMPESEANFRLIGLELAAIPAGPLSGSSTVEPESTTAVLDWSANSLFDLAQLYRSEKPGCSSMHSGSFPGVSHYEEVVSPCIKSAFFRLAVPLP